MTVSLTGPIAVLVVLVVSLVVWIFASHPKAQEVGRLGFFCALFWLVYWLLGAKL